jgi:hypothetical protein
LLCASLLSISWLGTEQKPPENSDTSLAEQDTVPGKKQQGARYSRKSIITLDENGQPHEEIVEEFEGDESLRPLVEQKAKRMPGLPDISAIPPFPALPPDPYKAFPFDTIPPGFGFNADEWEDLAKQFEQHLKDFELLHPFHEGDTSDFLRDFKPNMLWSDTSFLVPDHFRESIEQFEKAYKELDLNLHDLQMDEFQNLQREMHLDHFHMRSYQDELRKQLVEDGYLAEEEQIESLEWNDSTFKVNGKAIKKADNEKYQKLNREFFGRKKSDKLD